MNNKKILSVALISTGCLAIPSLCNNVDMVDSEFCQAERPFIDPSGEEKLFIHQIPGSLMNYTPITISGTAASSVSNYPYTYIPNK